MREKDVCQGHNDDIAFVYRPFTVEYTYNGRTKRYDISITTMLNYRFWRTAELETNDYITAHQPELLDKLAPFIFGVLKGELTAEDAISGIEHDILNEVE